MAKTNWGTIILLGALAVGGYFLYKWLKEGGIPFIGGGGGSTIITTTTETWKEAVPIVIDGTKVSVPNIPVPPGGFLPVDYMDMHNRAGVTQRWTKVSYGDPGQPSVAFKETTLKATPKVQGVGTVSPKVIVTTPTKTVTIAKPLAVSKGTPVVTVKTTPKATAQAQLAKSAVLAGAPPRVVAKIKGGTFY